MSRLSKQVIPIKFYSMNEKIPKTLGPIGMIDIVTNGIARKYSPNGTNLRIEKRPGSKSLSTAAVSVVDGSGALAVTNPVVAGTLDKQLVEVGDSTPYVYVDEAANKGWIQHPYVLPTNILTETPLYSKNSQLLIPDVARVGNVYCYTFSDNTGGNTTTAAYNSYYTIVDDTGVVIIAPTLIANGMRCKVVADNLVFWIFWETEDIASGHVNFMVVTPAGIVLASDEITYSQTVAANWDVYYDSSVGIVLAAPENAGTTSVSFISVVGVIFTITTYHPAIDSREGLGFLTKSYTTADAHFYLACINNTGQVNAAQITTSGTIANAYTVDATATTNLGNITGYVTASHDIVVAYSTLQPTTFDQFAGRNDITKVTKSFFGDGQSVITTQRSLSLASRPFQLQNDWYCVMFYQSTSAFGIDIPFAEVDQDGLDTQPCFFLMHLDTGQICGRFAYLDANAAWVGSGTINFIPFHLSSAVVFNGTTHIPLCVDGESIVSDTDGFPVNVSLVGVEDFSFSSASGLCGSFAEELFIPGPQATMFNGKEFHEDGLALAPEVISLGPAGVPGDLTPDENYVYAWTYEYLDENGNTIISIPSVLKEFKIATIPIIPFFSPDGVNGTSKVWTLSAANFTSNNVLSFLLADGVTNPGNRGFSVPISTGTPDQLNGITLTFGNAHFLSTDVGSYVYLEGCANAGNNGFRLIKTRTNNTQVTIDPTGMTNEVFSSSVQMFVGQVITGVSGPTAVLTDGSYNPPGVTPTTGATNLVTESFAAEIVSAEIYRRILHTSGDNANGPSMTFTFALGNFAPSDKNSDIEIFGSSHNNFIYTIFNVINATTIQVSGSTVTTETFGSAVVGVEISQIFAENSDHYDGAGSWFFANGESIPVNGTPFTPALIGSNLVVTGTAHNNGTWTIVDVPSINALITIPTGGVAEYFSGTPTFTLVSPNESSSTSVTTLRVGTKKNIRISGYRTWDIVNGKAGTVLSKITNDAAPIYNDPTIDSITFIDTVSDTVASQGQALYTQPIGLSSGAASALEWHPCPPFSTSCIAANRMWVLAPDNSIWVSNEKTAGFMLSFNPNIRIIMPTSDPIVSLVNMDGRVVIMGKTTLWAVDSQGLPDSNGVGSIPTPQQFPFITGAQGPALLMNMGVIYAAPAGIFLLNRDLTSTYIGGAVEDFTNSTSVTTISTDKNQWVYFTLANVDQMLIYDTVAGIWYIWQMGTVPQFGFSWKGDFCYVDNSSPALTWRMDGINTTDYLDNTNAINTCFTLRVIGIDTVNGFQRLWGMQVYGTYMGPHMLNIAVESSINGVFVTNNFSIDVPSDPTDYIWEIRPSQQKSRNFQIQFCDEFDQYTGLGPGNSFQIEALSLYIGVKTGLNKLPMSKRIPQT